MADANFVDKVVGYFDPSAGAKRAVNRRKMEVLRGARSYEGASKGRLSSGWKTFGLDQDALLALEGQTLRDRSRDLERNNPLATKIVATHANNFVGPGIMPRARTGNTKLNKKVDQLFETWSKECHVEGTLDFYGLSYQLARMMVVDGEVFVRRRPRRNEDGLSVPLQLQVLDSEFCDWAKNQPDESHPVISGIEFDKIGRRRGYWMHATNPQSRSFFSWRKRSAFVPAEDVIHLFEPKTKQIRGVPWLSPVIVDLKEVRDYEIAENVRKKVEACNVGVIIPGDGEDDPNIGIEEADDAIRTGIVDSQGYGIERMEPGMFVVARGGKDVRFNNPAMSVGVETYLRTRYRNISAGGRIPYELMTGDFSQSNFASGKLGLIDYRRFVDAVQWHILIHQCLNKVWKWFVEAAKHAGLIPMNAIVNVDWQPPEFENINRLDEAKADLLEVRMGKRSMPDVIAKTGRNPEEVLAEQDDWAKKVDATSSKLVFDSDPRRVTSNGQSQLLNEGDGDAGA